MVVSAPLTDVQWPALTEAFNLAFGDYDIPLSLTLEQLKDHMEAVSFSKADSIGLFDGTRLVGFLLIGRRGKRAWDGGTAIIPSHRGQGHAHTLVDETIKHLKKIGCSSFLLEVLKTNERAQRLYLSHGFVIRRALLCFKQEQSRVIQESSCFILREQASPFTAKNPFEPSWQNANESINHGSYIHATIIKDEIAIGAVAYNPTTGSIAQIILDSLYNTTQYLQEAIVAVAHTVQGDEVRMVNIDGQDTQLQAAFHQLGFELFTTQYEMERVL